MQPNPSSHGFCVALFLFILSFFGFSLTELFFAFWSLFLFRFFFFLGRRLREQRHQDQGEGSRHLDVARAEVQGSGHPHLAADGLLRRASTGREKSSGSGLARGTLFFCFLEGPAENVGFQGSATHDRMMFHSIISRIDYVISFPRLLRK